MAIRIEITSAQVKHGSQNRILQFNFEVKSWHSKPAFLAGSEGQVTYNNYTLSDHFRFYSYQFQNPNTIYLANDHHFQGSLEVNLSKEAIHYIEEFRKEGDIQFHFNIIYRWQKILNENQITPENMSNGNVLVGPTQWHETQTHYTIARSGWIQLLKQLRYSEIELFEIQKSAIIEKEIWDESMRLFKDAENTFRHGDFEGTLAKCRQSMEGLAKHYSPDDVKAGYALLLEKVFPNNKEKQEPINALITGISNFAHLGRHANNPPVKISKEDAEFVLISTLNLFSFFSQRLSKNSKVN